MSLTKNPPNNKNGIIKGGPIAVAICTVGDIADIKYPVIRTELASLLTVEIQQIHPFVPNASFLYPLKRSENLTVS